MPITEWKTDKIDIDSITDPINFEVRAVDAALDNKALYDEFSEFHINVKDSDKIIKHAMSIFSYNEGLTDIVLYVEQYKLAIVVQSYSYMHENQRVFKIDSLEELKMEMT